VLNTHFHRSRVDTLAIEEAVATFGCALGQSNHTEFQGFSTANPDLQQNEKQIWVINVFCSIYFFLWRLWILDEIMLQMKCSCYIFVVMMLDLLCPITSNVKRSIALFVYMLCLSTLTIPFFSVVWASPCHVITISRFKIGFEFIRVQVNDKHFPYCQENFKHFTWW